MKRKSRGFTLIEILLVIAILAILAGIITPNLITALKKSRDARKKEDLSNIQKAVEMYYEVNTKYPANLTWGGKLCDNPPTCVVGSTYMQVIPKDPSDKNSYAYNYVPASDQSYQLYATLENTLDPQIDPSITAKVLTCGTGHICNYGVSSPNTTP